LEHNTGCIIAWYIVVSVAPFVSCECCLISLLGGERFKRGKFGFETIDFCKQTFRNGGECEFLERIIGLRFFSVFGRPLRGCFLVLDSGHREHHLIHCRIWCSPLTSRFLCWFRFTAADFRKQ
ncbi:hypothetical protein Tcan_01769, partial [Toxocara canis]